MGFSSSDTGERSLGIPHSISSYQQDSFLATIRAAKIQSGPRHRSRWKNIGIIELYWPNNSLSSSTREAIDLSRRAPIDAIGSGARPSFSNNPVQSNSAQNKCRTCTLSMCKQGRIPAVSRTLMFNPFQNHKPSPGYLPQIQSNSPQNQRRTCSLNVQTRTKIQP